MAEPAPQIAIERRRPLGKGWPQVLRWRVTREEAIDGVELDETRRPDRYALAHRTTSGPPRWQVTWFDERGAGGDVRRDTLEEALNDGAPAAEYVVRALHLTSDRTRENPMPKPPTRAIAAFRRFHSRDWRGEGDFHADFDIPAQMTCAGHMLDTAYESDKLNPSTGEDEGWIAYNHKHDKNVMIAVPTRRSDQHMVAVPDWIRRETELVWLGTCLELKYQELETGRTAMLEGTNPKPDIFFTPKAGRAALLVVQSKRRLMAIIWGGKMQVQRRGIVW